MERTEVRVQGMDCGGCETTVSKALLAPAGVRDVKTDHETGVVSIEADTPLDRDELARAIADAGYALAPA